MKRARQALLAPIFSPGAEVENYPFNHWWVAAFANEIVEGQPLGRQLLGKSVLLYRKADGAVVAMENRCPHRAAPLSLGEVDGDNISCRYHGLQFDPQGRCVHVPTQARIPPSSTIRTYPIIESGPLVWIWTGDPARAGEGKPVERTWMFDPSWLHVQGTIPLAANYMSLKENVLDLSHFGFVHPKTFRIKGWLVPPKVTTTDGIVRYENRFDHVPLPHMDAKMAGLGERPVNLVSWGESLSPALHEAGMDAVLVDPAPGERMKFTWRILHITTPASPRSAHYWWLLGADYGQDMPEVTEWLYKSVTEAFLEDKLVLEAIQAAADADPEYSKGGEISVKADQSGLQARRLLSALIERVDGPGKH